MWESNYLGEAFAAALRESGNILEGPCFYILESDIASLILFGDLDLGVETQNPEITQNRHPSS